MSSYNDDDNISLRHSKEHQSIGINFNARNYKNHVETKKASRPHLQDAMVPQFYRHEINVEESGTPLLPKQRKKPTFELSTALPDFFS